MSIEIGKTAINVIIVGLTISLLIESAVLVDVCRRVNAIDKRVEEVHHDTRALSAAVAKSYGDMLDEKFILQGKDSKDRKLINAFFRVFKAYIRNKK